MEEGKRKFYQECSLELQKELIEKLKEKYRCTNQVLTCTKELESAMQNNDEICIALVLKMRAQELEAVQLCNQWLEGMLVAQGIHDREIHLYFTKGKGVEEQEVDEVVTFLQGIKIMAMKACALDEKISKKVLGQKSYYEKK